MKIALVTDFFLPSLGGLQTSTVSQRNSLESSGNEVFIFTSEYKDKEPTDDDHVMRVKSTYFAGLGFPMVTPSVALKKLLLNEFKRLKIDVIHIQTEFGLAQAAIWAGKQLGIPVFYTSHTYAWRTTYPSPKAQAKVIRMMYRLLYGQKLVLVPALVDEDEASTALRSIRALVTQDCDVLICPSKHMQEALAHDRKGKPSFVVPNPVMQISKLQPKDLPKTIRFVWPSRIEPEKRIVEFVKAVLIANKITQANFIVDIIGDGSLLDEVKFLAADAKNVKFHGRLTQEQTIEIMDNSSIVVMSSHGYDNQPMVIAEALSRERGVLYCDANLTDSLKDAGYLCGPAPKQIAQGIKELADDPSKIKKLNKAAILNKDQFTGKTYSDTMTKLYKNFKGKL